MFLIAWLLIGGSTGWLASLIFKEKTWAGIWFYIIIGMIGTLIGGTFIIPYIGLATQSVGGLFVLLSSAIVMLVICDIIFKN
jgi:uncharacterized membrane protein YeaQ/YmgE (transglycosylase-associated protein family)